MKQAIKDLLQAAGWRVGRYDQRTDPAFLRRRLMRARHIDTVLDVGANSGQYARQLRKEGYQGRIVSFEPLSAAYRALSEAATGDTAWETHHCALGRTPGTAQINVAGNSWSSSLLPMLPSHSDAAPESVYVGQETIEVRRLDDVVPGLCPPESAIFMKVDTQGFTMEVLQGAQSSLARIVALQVELSLVPLYGGEPLIGEVLTFLYGQGYVLVQLEPEFTNEEGVQLQVNGLLVRP